MYPRIKNQNKYINIFSDQVNEWLDQGYDINLILKNAEYPIQQQMILPKEINKHILLLLDDVDLININKTCTYFNKLINRNYFWQYRLNYLYPQMGHIISTIKDDKLFYICLFKIIQKIKTMKNNIIIIHVYKNFLLNNNQNEMLLKSKNHLDVFLDNTYISYKTYNNISHIINSIYDLVKICHKTFDYKNLYISSRGPNLHDIRYHMKYN